MLHWYIIVSHILYFYLLQWRTFKNDEKFFHFILKAVFVLKIFQLLSWIFGHVEKTAWIERLISKFMISQPGYQTITIHKISSNISSSKSNQTIKFGRLIEYKPSNIFFQKSWRKWGRVTSYRPLFVFIKILSGLQFSFNIY